MLVTINTFQTDNQMVDITTIGGIRESIITGVDVEIGVTMQLTREELQASEYALLSFMKQNGFDCHSQQRYLSMTDLEVYLAFVRHFSRSVMNREKVNEICFIMIMFLVNGLWRSDG